MRDVLEVTAYAFVFLVALWGLVLFLVKKVIK